MRIEREPERGRAVRRACRTVSLLAAVAVTAAACQVAVGDERVYLPPADVRIVQPAQVSVPPGHLPPPGQCRVWYPDRPPGQQPPPGPCGYLQVRVPAGAVLVRG